MSGRAASEAIIPGRAAISVGNPNTPLPRGWAWTALISVAKLGTGHTPSRKHPEYWGGDVPWIGIRDAGAHHGGVIWDTTQHINQLGLDNSSARLLPKDTICLSRTASVGYVVKMGRDMATSQDFVTWSCSDAILPDYLLKALLAEGADIKRFGEGSTHTTIYFPELKAFHIALPPQAEQRQIVAKIDSLSVKSRRVRNHLDHIPLLVEKYKQAILATALSQAGEQGEYVPLAEAIASTFYGPRFAKEAYGSEGVVTLRTTDFDDDGNVRLKSPPLVRVSVAELSKWGLVDGDLLVTRTGSIGKCAVYSQSIGPALPSAYLIRVRLRLERVRPRYVLLFLLSNSGQQQLGLGITAVTQPNINASVIERLELPIPDLDTQDRIIRNIETAFAWIDRLACEANSARNLIDHLDQAILAKAFRGELVPQATNNEPASKLSRREPPVEALNLQHG